MGLWSWTKDVASSTVNALADAGDAMVKWANTPSEPETPLEPGQEPPEDNRSWGQRALDKLNPVNIAKGIGNAATGVAKFVVKAGDKVGQGAEWLTHKENWGKMRDGLVHYKNFLRDDPAGFFSMVGQGSVNAVTATVGLVGDLGVAAIRLGTPIGWVATIHNLGCKPEDKWTLGLPKFGECTTGLTDWTNKHMVETLGWDWAREPQPYLYARDADGNVIVDEGGRPVFQEMKDKDGNIIRDENGQPKLVEDPYYKCKVITKNVTQGIGEIGVFVAVSALTAGTAGAAIAAARAGALAARGAMAATRVGRLALTVGRTAGAVTKVPGMKSYFNLLGKGIAKVPVSPKQAFVSGFKGGAKWMSPIQKKSWLSAHYAEKSVKLTGAAKDFQKASLFTKINSLGNKNTVFNKAAKAATKADNLDAAIALRPSQNRIWRSPIFGKRSGPGWGTRFGEWGPEAAGLALMTSTGAHADFKKGLGTEDLSDFRSQYGQQAELSSQQKLIIDTLKSFREQGIPLIESGLTPQLIEENGVTPEMLQENGFDPQELNKELSDDFSASALPHPAQQPGETSLSDAANFAFDQDYQFTQSLNTGFAFSPSLNPYRIGSQNIFTTSGVTAA